jgi:hypothetical protein
MIMVFLLAWNGYDMILSHSLWNVPLVSFLRNLLEEDRSQLQTESYKLSHVKYTTQIEQYSNYCNLFLCIRPKSYVYDDR